MCFPRAIAGKLGTPLVMWISAPVLLPIDPIKPVFLDLLTQHHLVVEAETGSGKSTRLPLWAAEQGRVLVIQPRRIACTSLAEFLADQACEKIGQSIGYAIRFDSHFDDQTKVVFVTPGVALRWMSEGQLASFDIIIIDEMHLRRWDTDLLMALLKQHNTHRLVATSATLDSQRLADYMGAKPIRAEGRCFPVAVEHQASDPRHSPDSRHLDSKIRTAVDDIFARIEGDILVFLPGRKEISQCMNSLSHLDAEVIPLHASVSDTDRHRALNESDHRRIILATNVAETSLTIPGVTVIIDSGLERRTHQRNGRTVLGLHAISRASAEQRKGRAGRIVPGLCIRLYGSAAPLELLTPPELHREELVEPMLASACCGYRLNDLAFLDPLPEKTLSQAFVKLRQMQAIDNKGKITEHGKRIYPLPIDSLFAHLITAMPDKASQEAMVDLAAALSIPQRLYQPPKNEQALDQLQQWEKHHCDATTLIKLIRYETPDFLHVDDDLLAEARMMAAQIRSAMMLPQLSVATAIKRDGWLNAVMQAAPELVFVRREKRRQALANGISEATVGRDSRYSDSAEAAVIFDQYSMPGRGVKQTLSLGTCIAPVKLNQLIELDFGELELAESQIVDGQCLSVMKRRYAGRVIEVKKQEPAGKVVSQTIVEMILNNKLLNGLAEKINHEISQWNLYLTLGRNVQRMSERSEPAELISWLTEQIDALGIESVDDIMLFHNDDFVFAGIPEWETANFNAEFPRKLTLAELNLTVEYDVARKRVYVVYASGNRKNDPKRWELPRWPGWKVQYKKASRVINVK